MSEEILFDKSMIEGRFGQRGGVGRAFTPGFGNGSNERWGDRGDRDCGRLNPRARSFFVYHLSRPRGN